MAHVANKCRHLIGGLRRKLAVIHLFSNLIMVCIRPSKSHTVPALTMTHVAERFSSEGDLKNSSGEGSSFQTASFPSAHRCWKNTTCSHTSVDAANVVCESRRRYNYHRSANYCVYHRKTQQQSRGSLNVCSSSAVQLKATHVWPADWSKWSPGGTWWMWCITLKHIDRRSPPTLLQSIIYSKTYSTYWLDWTGDLLRWLSSDEAPILT